jgi:hypothetical protein
VISIDPGLTGTGYAVFGKRGLIRCGVLTAPRGWEWYDKIRWYCDELETIYERQSITARQPIVLELPEFFQSAGGQLTARSQALVKLSMLTGAIHYCLGVGVLITPTKWKGQLPKEVVVKRLRKRLGTAVLNRVKPSSHAWDAIGIGLYYLGEF